MTPGVKAFTCSEIFDGHKRHEEAALLVEAGRVVDICRADALAADIPCQELGSGLVVPGLVDLQVNGGGGVMLNNAPAPETVEAICRAHARCGTTSLLPTLVTDTPEVTNTAISAVERCLANSVPGVLGMHLEGPHLSVARKGAHDPNLIRPMSERDAAALEKLTATFSTLFLTVAPESVSNAQISRLATAGAVVSLGHSDCSSVTAVEAAKSGASVATHLFNAMSPLGSREPGLVGAVLGCGELSAGLIADGFHVDIATIRIAMRAKAGPGRIFLVSDAMATIDSDIDGFDLNGRRILRRGGRLTLSDGTLAGADIDLLSAVRVMVEQVALDADEALRMASLYPAQLIGRSAEVGNLKQGTCADFLLLDGSLQLKSVWQRGELVN